MRIAEAEGQDQRTPFPPPARDDPAPSDVSASRAPTLGVKRRRSGRRWMAGVIALALLLAAWGAVSARLAPLGGASAIVGICLVSGGLRGRLLDDRPYCARCRFDLSGLPSAAVCPECGATLAAPTAVRRGRYGRRPAPIWTGALLLALGAGAAAADLWGGASGFRWNTHKPVWLLRWQASLVDPWFDGGASRELALRFVTGRLTNAQGDGLVADMIAAAEARQGRETWQYTDVLDAAWMMGRLGPAELNRLTPHLVRLRWRVEGADGWPDSLIIDAVYQNGWRSAVQPWLSLDSVTLDGTPLPRFAVGRIRFGSDTRAEYQLPADFESGRLEVAWRLQALNGSSGRSLTELFPFRCEVEVRADASGRIHSHDDAADPG